jgi:peptide chain release factor 2
VAQSQNERSQIQNRATAMQILRSRLLERKELEQAEELAKERGEQKSAEWGSQIRSYFLHPDQRVKDHRTNYEVGDTNRVLDGDIDAFVREYLNLAAGSSNT